MEVVFTPARFEPSRFDATLGCPFLFEQIERHVAQDDKVLLAVSFAHATGVFLKGDIEHPVETIFDTPVTADCAPKGSGVACQARDVIATFARDLLAHFALRFDHANAA